MWKNMKLPMEMSAVEETGVSLDMLHTVGKSMHTIPGSFALHKTLKRELEGKAVTLHPNPNPKP